MKKKYTSTISAAVHETVSDLYEIGLVDKTTMRHFDATCLLPKVPDDYTPEQISSLRSRLNVSQSIFASYLNASTSTVQAWEQGLKRPSGTARRVLDMLDRKGLDVVL